ncbi:GTPase HflX [Azospirillum thermophilum]|nr:GTPase HflX [Azospirillum thermophilum]
MIDRTHTAQPTRAASHSDDPAEPDAPRAGLGRALVVLPLIEGAPPAGQSSGGGSSAGRSPESRLEEAVRLAGLIGLEVAHAEAVPVRGACPRSLFGRNGMERLGGLVEAFRADVVIVDHALTPIQQRALERGCLAKLLDRTGLVLEAMRLHRPDAAVPLDLASLIHQRTRMVRCWTAQPQRRDLGFHVAPADGMPGETLMERDRRLITERIAMLKRTMRADREERQRRAAARRAAGIPTVAVLGYAGAGVSSLIDRLGGQGHGRSAGEREAVLPSGRRIVLMEPPGLLRDLPHHAATAMRALLEDVPAADLILHVRDAADPDSGARAADMAAMLSQLGIDPQGDPRVIEVLTRTDLLAPTAQAALSLSLVDAAAERTVAVSALSGEGLDDLAALLDRRLARMREPAALLDRSAVI